jgi:hypothetical protein
MASRSPSLLCGKRVSGGSRLGFGGGYTWRDLSAAAFARSPRRAAVYPALSEPQVCALFEPAGWRAAAAEHVYDGPIIIARSRVDPFGCRAIDVSAWRPDDRRRQG